MYESGSKYGESIIEKYSNKLTTEINKKYNKRTLYRMRKFYKIFSNKKVTTLLTQLTWSHYLQLLAINSFDKIEYYINIAINQNLSVRELREKIKNKEYERLPEKTRNKLTKQEENKIEDFIKNPILIKNTHNYQEISEKILKQLILEDLDNFLTELGSGFTYIKNEYKIKLGSIHNYIDLLLYNIIYNCYVVIELKVTELKKEHIGQIQTYMNYIDKNIRSINQDKTIGIIICKKDNLFIMEYCSDERIYRGTYELL